MSANAFAQDKPNIVYILVDNWGWADIRIQGGSIPTPRIDALASEGLRMTNFNVENQCTPTRSAIMTGRLPGRVSDEIFASLDWWPTLANAGQHNW